MIKKPSVSELNTSASSLLHDLFSPPFGQCCLVGPSERSLFLTFKLGEFFKGSFRISSVLSSAAAFLRIRDPSSSRESIILATSSNYKSQKENMNLKTINRPYSLYMLIAHYKSRDIVRRIDSLSSNACQQWDVWSLIIRLSLVTLWTDYIQSVPEV